MAVTCKQVVVVMIYTPVVVVTYRPVVVVVVVICKHNDA